MSIVTVTAHHIHQLFDSPAEHPVLYYKEGPDDEGGDWELDVRDEAYVHATRIVATRTTLIDHVTGEDPDDEEILDAVQRVQEFADEAAGDLDL
jgi:hypothetical protein